MNKVLIEIAAFSEYGECVVIRKDDWENLRNWVKSHPSAEAKVPNFDILPVTFTHNKLFKKNSK